MNFSKKISINWENIPKAATNILIILILILSILFFHQERTGKDWITFRTATRYLIFDGNPYLRENFYNPPWILFPLIPISLLPEKLSYYVIIILNLITYGFLAHYLGARKIIILIFLLTPFVQNALSNGQIDFIATFGIILPPQIGLFFILSKPQAAGMLAVYWLFISWKKGKIKEVIKVFSPVTIAFGISFLLYGFYPLKASKFITEELAWNQSLWPYSIPIGLLVLGYAIYKNNKWYAISSTPLLSPYFNPYSLPAAFLGFIKNELLFLILVFIYWLL